MSLWRRLFLQKVTKREYNLNDSSPRVGCFKKRGKRRGRAEVRLNNMDMYSQTPVRFNTSDLGPRLALFLTNKKERLKLTELLDTYSIV
jgi:hypothetical protein